MPLDYLNAVFSPHETAEAGRRAAVDSHENADLGIGLYIPGTDIHEYFAPLMPWEICAVQAQTSNGKSTFLDFWEHGIAKQLRDTNRQNEIIIHVSLEETIEALAFYQYARFMEEPVGNLIRGKVSDWSKFEWAMTKIDQVAIWRIADSSTRQEDAPEMYLSNIYRAIRDLADGKVTGNKFKVAVVVIDYLQALPIDPEIRKAVHDAQRRLQVREDVYRMRKMTTFLTCPVITAIQAKQHMEGNNPPFYIPGVYDGEETSSIAQRFDRIMGLWMPKTKYTLGTCVDGGVGMITDNGIWLKVNKQRGGLPAGKSWELAIDYQKRQFSSALGKTIAEKMVERKDIE